jgi:hypothetical protein
MTFDEWWKKTKPAECDELKPYFEEAWELSAETGCEALKTAITGLLKFHQEGDDGAELPREYWSTGYREAVEIAEALVGSNG